RRAAFADAAPFRAARWHEIDLDLRGFGLAHDTIGVEIQLLHLSGLDRHLAIEHGREAVDRARLHLRFDDLRVHHMIAIHRHHQAIDADLIAIAHGDLRDGADHRAVVFGDRDAAAAPLGQLLLPIALL